MKNILRIQRPSGEIELKDVSGKFPEITRPLYGKICEAELKLKQSIVLGFAEGGLCEVAHSNSRRTMAAILGGSRNENNDTSARALRGGY